MMQALTGTVTARTSETPTDSASLFYTVRIYLPGREGGRDLKISNIQPPPSRRFGNGSPDVNLVPFEIGSRVLVHAIGSGSKTLYVLESVEAPEYGGCP